MELEIKVINLNSAIKSLLYTLIFNTIIAIFLTIMNFGRGLLSNFIFSQCMGLSICSCVLVAYFILKPTSHTLHLIVIITSLLIGSLIGALLGSIATGIDLSIFFQKYDFLKAVLLGIIFGAVITYFFVSREIISLTKEKIQEERIKRLISEKKMIESNLRLLQAQIEPHFLFNTLSNILSLLETDLGKGKSMLMNLVQYLRTSLPKSRRDTTTIGQEMDRIRTYLNIFSIRMGDRLRYKFHIPSRIKNISFPPMLLQPLVENAIKHGLEPKIEGGEISIHAKEEGNILRLEITDTGQGFHADSYPGIGHTNIRERLKSLYGDKGRLILEENQPSGMKAIIEVPHEAD